MTDEQMALFIEFQNKLYETFTDEQKAQFQEDMGIHWKRNSNALLSYGAVWTWFTTG